MGSEQALRKLLRNAINSALPIALLAYCEIAGASFTARARRARGPTGGAISVVGLLATILLAISSPSVSAAYVFQDIMFPGSFQTRTYDVNNLGHIVGYYQDQGPGGTHGFVLRDGVFSALPLDEAYKINDAGDIVGRINNQPVLYRDGTVTPIDIPGAIYASVFGINNQGDMVGGYLPTTGPHESVIISGLNYYVPHIPGMQDSVAWGISDDGAVLGTASTGTRSLGYIYRDGNVAFIDASLYVPGSYSTILYDINSKGQIAGLAAGGRDVGFVYDSSGFRVVADPTGRLTQVTGINDDGVLVGAWAYGPSPCHGFMAVWTEGTGGTPGNEVPEPTTFVLLSTALFGLYFTQRLHCLRPKSQAGSKGAIAATAALVAAFGLRLVHLRRSEGTRNPPSVDLGQP